MTDTLESHRSAGAVLGRRTRVRKPPVTVRTAPSDASIVHRRSTATPVERSKYVVRAFALLIAATIAVPAFSQRMDSFEGDTPRWRLVESDCDAQLTLHEISSAMPHSGRACELFEVSCSYGKQVLLAYPIEPSAVLNEFQPSMWVRCASGNIRLGIRVVFPNAVDPHTQNRLTKIIWGDTYNLTGRWQRLRVTRIADQLQQEIVSIRQQFEQAPNLEHPIIDALVLNAYTGPGRYRVQVDDLELLGMIPLASIGTPLHPNWLERWRWQEFVEPRFAANPSFPVWMQHRGEEPAWVGSLGFSGLLLAEVPSPQQLSMIYEAGLQAITPAPQHAVEFDPQQLSAVRGWLVGVALNREQLEVAKKNIARAERLPEPLRRPLVGEALEHFWLYSRMTNEMIIPAADPSSAGDVSSKRQWLARTIQSVGLRGNGWVSIQVGPGPSIVEQVRAAKERIEGERNLGVTFEDESNFPELIIDEFVFDEVPSAPVNPLGLRHEVAGAVMSGAKGILYRTHTALTDPIGLQSTEDRALQAAMRWCNNDLELWSPWLANGQTMPPPTVSRQDYAAARWRVRDADLILVQNVAPESQWCLPATRTEPLIVQSTDGTDAPQAIRLTEGRLEIMSFRASTGNQSWQVDRPNPLEIFVVTRNPQVIGYLRRRLESQAVENASDQLEIASYCVEQVSQLFDARFASVADPVAPESQRIRQAQQQRLSEISNRLERGWQALQARQPQSAIAMAFEVFELAQSSMHEAFLVANSNLATPQSSPFVLIPGTLKYHWIVADACARSRWQPVTIPGSQFTNLSEMLRNGWTQQRRLQDLADFRVELVPASDGVPNSLRLAAYSKTLEVDRFGGKSDLPVDRRSENSPGSFAAQTIPGGYEGASLRVRSASFPVKKGQFIRITAQALVRHAGPDATSGVLFYDNQAGPSLGQLVRGVPGQRVPVELYRFVVADGEFRVLAECRGECDVQIENLSASLIEPATKRRGFVTAPLEEMDNANYSEIPVNSSQP